MAVADVAESTRPRRTLAAIACVLLAVAFSLHAWLATRTKSATFDEPIHALSAWLIVNRSDFRVNPEHPPLWKYLAGLPLRGFPMTIDLDAPPARAVLAIIERQWFWGTDQLYRTPGNDGVALVARARVAMAILPMCLALAVARWAWLIRGPTAAVVATALVSLDPNLLAHGALVTNDVAATLAITLAALLTWQLGRRFTWPRAAVWTLVVALSLGVKFTCVLLAPMLGVPLLAWAGLPRVFSPSVGQAFLPVTRPPAQPSSHVDEPLRGGDQTGRTACPTSRRHRLAIVCALGVATGALALASLWPMYQFRSSPTRDRGNGFDSTYVRRLNAYYSLQRAAAQAGTPMTDRALREAVPRFAPSAATRAIYWLQDRGVVPQAFGVGLSYANGRSHVRPAFLMGEPLAFGSPWYFPLALLFKTPAVTLATALVALIAFGPIVGLAARAESTTRWTLLCLAFPPLVYLAAAAGAGLNIGVRHVLPVLPPLYVGLGVAGAYAIERWRRRAQVAVTALAVATAVEVCAAFPNYLAFFNAPSGGASGGLALLSDSNLDWGQDLPALARWYGLWRSGNPTAPFYLSYFGSVEPRAYGIDYVNAVPGYPFAAQAATDAYLRDGGVLAIGATPLQGVNAPASFLPTLEALRASPPLDVINGSIYIYRLPGRAR